MRLLLFDNTRGVLFSNNAPKIDLLLGVLLAQYAAEAENQNSRQCKQYYRPPVHAGLGQGSGLVL
jgi:hypothetical protein